MNVCSSVIVILGLGFGSGWTATALPQSMPAAPQAVEACPRIEGVEVLVSAQRAELVDAAFELVAFLPRTGTAYLGAERALARVEREGGRRGAFRGGGSAPLPPPPPPPPPPPLPPRPQRFPWAGPPGAAPRQILR